MTPTVWRAAGDEYQSETLKEYYLRKFGLYVDPKDSLLQNPDRYTKLDTSAKNGFSDALTAILNGGQSALKTFFDLTSTKAATGQDSALQQQLLAWQLANQKNQPQPANNTVWYVAAGVVVVGLAVWLITRNK